MVVAAASAVGIFAVALPFLLTILYSPEDRFSLLRERDVSVDWLPPSDPQPFLVMLQPAEPHRPGRMAFLFSLRAIACIKGLNYLHHTQV